MNRTLAREAIRLLERHESFVRATVVRAQGSVPGKIGASMIVRRDGSTLGTVGGAALEEEVKARAADAFDSRRGDLYHYDLQKWKPGGLPSLCGGEVDIAVEFVAARPNLLLWGGGHVAKAIADLLPTIDCDFSVADDRPDWVGADRFANAERREVASPAELFDRFEPSDFTHLYLLGYDAAKDLEVLARALEVFPNQIGLISSAAKREHMFAELRARGVARRALERVRAPIGLDIGAESPGEIAISVAAEIVRALHPAQTRSRARATVRSPVRE